MGEKDHKNKKLSSNSKTTGRHRGKKRNSVSAEKSAFKKSGKEEQKKAKQLSHKPITGWRLWVFRLVAATLIPVVFFLLLDVALSMVGYGFPANLIIKTKAGNTASYTCNLKYAWKFFPPKISRTTEPFIFPAAKSDNTYRIFIMGASAAAGTPDGAFAFGRILQTMLAEQYPKVKFEVIICAMPAINSYAIVDIEKDCLRHQGDLFIVYLGNNEVVGPYGAGTVFSPLSSNLSLIRFGIAFKGTKLGQLLNNIMGSLRTGDTPQVWQGMEMFLKKQVRANEPAMQVVYEHYQKNLEDIRDLASRKQIKTIFCTVPGNLKDNPPFASLHRPDLTEPDREKWETIYQQGIALEKEGDYSSAANKYLEAAELDDSYADLQFRLGRVFWEMGEYEKSRQRYINARELDTLRFRADNRINEIIHSVSENRTSEGIYLVDALKTFEQNSPHSTAGNELFYEHVHMNFHGNYILATELFKQVTEILPERVVRLRKENAQLLSESECARRLAFTGWERYKILEKVLNEFIKQPPFTNQLYHDAKVVQMQEQVNALKVSLTPDVMKQVQEEYQQAIKGNPSDWWLYDKYAKFLEDTGNYNAALIQFNLALKYMPHDYEVYAKIGVLSGMTGNIDDAIKYNLMSLKLSPFFADAHFNLGLAYQFKNMFSEAVEEYSKAIDCDSKYAQAYSNMGAVLFQTGKPEQAIKTYQTGLEYMPDSWDLRYNLGIIFNQQGKKAEAIQEFREALKIDPNNAKARNMLNSLSN